MPVRATPQGKWSVQSLGTEFCVFDWHLNFMHVFVLITDTGPGNDFCKALIRCNKYDLYGNVHLYIVIDGDLVDLLLEGDCIELIDVPCLVDLQFALYRIGVNCI